uniref:Uncharacterized protein n=1 Tax=Triticum urartu TaxID=4572 RepID=A0A8R7VDK8_TRIUA
MCTSMSCFGRSWMPTSQNLLKKPLCSPLALSVGSDSNGSGVVALLKIARIFSHIYTSPKTRSKFNLLFGLTSGGPYN